MKNKYGYNLSKEEKKTVKDAVSIIESYGSVDEIEKMID